MEEKRQGRRIRRALLSSILFALAAGSLLITFSQDPHFPDGDAEIFFACGLLGVAVVAGAFAWFLLYRTYVEMGDRALHQPPVLFSLLLLLPSLPVLCVVLIDFGVFWSMFEP